MITDAAVAYYEDEDDTTDVEKFEDLANDVYVDGSTEQARKYFALERRREGKLHDQPIHSLQFVYDIFHLLEIYQLFLSCVFTYGAGYVRRNRFGDYRSFC